MKVLWILLTTILISSCNNTIREKKLFLDLDWKQDVYNIIYSHFDYIDDIEIFVKSNPKYVNGSLFRKACVEVNVGVNKPRFYMANIDLYSLTEVNSCDNINANTYNDQLVNENITAHKNKSDLNNSNLKNSKLDNGVDYYIYNERKSLFSLNDDNKRDKFFYKENEYLSIVFTSLFPVNEYELTQQGKEILQNFINELSTISVIEMTIYGIADSSGSYVFNRQLADKRAKTVYQFIRSSGIKNIPMKLKASVENHENTALERIQQRRFIIEMRLKP